MTPDIRKLLGLTFADLHQAVSELGAVDDPRGLSVRSRRYCQLRVRRAFRRIQQIMRELEQ